MLKIKGRIFLFIPGLILGLIIIPVSLQAGELDYIRVNKVKPLSSISHGFSAVESLEQANIDLQSRANAGIQSDLSYLGLGAEAMALWLNSSSINDPQTHHYNCDIPFTVEDLEQVSACVLDNTVKLSLKKPQENKFIAQGFAGNNNTQDALLSFSRREDNLGLRFSGQKQRSDGQRYDTGYKAFTASSSVNYAFPQAQFNFNAGYQEKDFGAYDFYTPAKGYPSYEWTKTVLVNTDLVWDNGELLVKPGLLWRRHNDTFVLDKTGIRSLYQAKHRNDTFMPSIYLQLQESFLGQAGLGFEQASQNVRSSGLGSHKRRYNGIWLDDTYQVNQQVSLESMLRLKDYNHGSDLQEFSCKINYNYSADTVVNIGMAKLMRPASFTELYYSDPTTVGNVSLDAEQFYQYSAGLEYQRPSIAIGVAPFWRDERNIDWVKVSPEQTLWQAQNIADSRAYGIQTRSSLRLSRYLRMQANYTYVNKSSSGQAYIYKYGPNYSRHLCDNRWIFSLPFGTQELDITYKKKPGRDGWWLLNCVLNYQVSKPVGLFLKADNIFNQEYQEIEGIASSGRCFLAGIRIDML